MHFDTNWVPIHGVSTNLGIGDGRSIYGPYCILGYTFVVCLRRKTIVLVVFYDIYGNDSGTCVDTSYARKQNSFYVL
jgi:hypothetical protein